MTVDFWSSTQLKQWMSPSRLLDTDEVVYTINAIDSLADQLPKYVRNAHLHYTAMILAHRYLESARPDAAVDGQVCCEVATLALAVAIESDGRTLSQSLWDSAVLKIFPCEVVHRGIWSAVEAGKGAFLEALGFDLFVYHPFETVSLLLPDAGVAGVAFSIVNSLYRTPVVIANPPYVVAIAAVVGALLLNGADHKVVSDFLNQQPVDVSLVESILTDHLYTFIKLKELPLSNPPPVENLPSPSARTGRSVSRQSSRVASTRSVSTTKRKRKAAAADEEPSSSLAWALLPAVDEEFSFSMPVNSGKGGIRRPVSLCELRILKEISQMDPPKGLIRLEDVRLYTSAEEGIYRPSGSAFVVNGGFDSNGSQFDSIVRLLSSYESLVDITEQLLSAVLFLNELKVCHFGIEPQNIMVTSDGIKIASLATASVLPSIPSCLPSPAYRAPELLLAGTPAGSMAVDLWSLGCVLAETTRIFSTRNRYEDPLFKLSDTMPDKPKERFPIHDQSVYTICRYLIRIAERLNKGAFPSKDVWPDFHRRSNYESFAEMLAYKITHYPERKGNLTDDVRTYLKDGPDGVMTEIVMALLRWCPDRRVNPRVCLNRIIKFRIN